MRKINATPLDLAMIVFNKFKNLKNQSHELSKKILVELFQNLFYASLKTEENNFIKVTIILIHSSGYC